MFEGLERNIFDEIMVSFKERYGVAKKFQFPPEQMRLLALSYKEAMQKRGVRIMDNPYQQLQHAIFEVFASWDSEQARIYRRQMHLSDEWGTAVIVQAMVFGNLLEHSGSGVIFTRDPKGSSQDVDLNGDFIFCVQGDDIVSGLVETFPISEKQRMADRRESPLSLEARYPEIYAELVRMRNAGLRKGIQTTRKSNSPSKTHEKRIYICRRGTWQRETGKVRLRDSASWTSLSRDGHRVKRRALTAGGVLEKKSSTSGKEPGKALILIVPTRSPTMSGIIPEGGRHLTARGGAPPCGRDDTSSGKVGVVGFNRLRCTSRRGTASSTGRPSGAGTSSASTAGAGPSMRAATPSRPTNPSRSFSKPEPSALPPYRNRLWCTYTARSPNRFV